MRDALGGTVNVVIIIFFIVFALGYMAFNVNYTKAFRMKDKIFYVYEKNQGICRSDCMTEIQEYAQKIGYMPDIIECEAGEELEPKDTKLFCVKAVPVTEVSDINTRCYYRIVTRVNISVPVLEGIMRLAGRDANGNSVSGPTRISAFYVTGDTKTIALPEGVTKCGEKLPEVN